MMSENNLDDISVVAITMTLHQLFEGLSLGCIFFKVRNKVSTIKIMFFNILCTDRTYWNCNNLFFEKYID